MATTMVLAVWFSVALVFGTVLGRFIHVGAGGPEPRLVKVRSEVGHLPPTNRWVA